MTQEQIVDAQYARLLREGLGDADPEFAQAILASFPEKEEREKTERKRKISSKFHRIFGKELTVALESTLDMFSDKEFEIDRNLYAGNKDLIFRNDNCWRVYYPARVDGDILTDNDAKIVFLPWFSGPEVMYNRLTLRCRPITGRVYRWMAFARFDEEKPFSFSLAKTFINLDFYSKRNNQFLPLFVKVKADGEDFIYFVLEGSWGEAEVTLNIRRVAESDVPPHLASAKP